MASMIERSVPGPELIEESVHESRVTDRCVVHSYAAPDHLQHFVVQRAVPRVFLPAGFAESPTLRIAPTEGDRIKLVEDVDIGACDIGVP